MIENTYSVPTEVLPEVIKSLNRLSRKAATYGNTLTYTVSDPYAAVRGYYENDHLNHVCRALEREEVEVVDLHIECDIIRKGNYVVLAKLDHSPEGNVVRALTDEVSAEWSHIAPRCEHCNSNHGLKYTFMVRNEDDGTVAQIGSRCLRDYTGINPQSIGLSNELHDIFLDDEDRDLFEDRAVSPVYNSLKALALATKLVETRGYIPSSEPHSNKSLLGEDLGNHEVPEEKYMEKARHYADYLRTADLTGDNLLSNVSVMLRCEYCKPDTLGYMAYAPLAVEKALQKAAKAAQIAAMKATEAETSKHVGAVGERLTIDLSSVRLLSSWETEYGITHLYKLVDITGNVFIWFASSVLPTDAKRIKGTVKAHDERDGVAQTIITRCKAC